MTTKRSAGCVCVLCFGGAPTVVVPILTLTFLFCFIAELVPVVQEVKALRISCHVDDDTVSVDELSEKIQEIEDHVQSVDIHSFVKL